LTNFDTNFPALYKIIRIFRLLGLSKDINFLNELEDMGLIDAVLNLLNKAVNNQLGF
jgi:hypothetical protein